jgi:hypothetical protein
MHNQPGMPQSQNKPTSFDRLRRAPVLRVVLVVAALLASQNSLACAFEAVDAADQASALVASAFAGASEVESDEDCCSLCLDCASCGGCHGSAVSPRAGNPHLLFRTAIYKKITDDAAAPKLWTPPAVLRPPIDAA